MSAFRWVKNLFTKKENENTNSISKKKSLEKSTTLKKKPDELIVESIAAQFFFLQGLGSGKYDCLDTYGLYDKHAEVFSFYAVFDGLGTSGKEASNSVCDFMLSYIDRHHQKIIKADRDSVIYDLLNSMFLKAEDSLRTVGLDMDLSGTTCVCVLAKGTALYVANVGDSRAVLGRIAAQHRFAVELTQDHKPHVRKERERILKNGGSIRKIMSKDDPVGPYRIWADEDGPGLGLTRCLGNFASKKIGMISSPSIQKILLKEVDQFVVIATDGLWEVMSSTDVVAFILRLGEDRSQAAKQLVIEARHIWYELNRIKKTEAKISDSPEVRFGIDDISAIIIFFSYEGVQFTYNTRAQNSPTLNALEKSKAITITVDPASELKMPVASYPSIQEDAKKDNSDIIHPSKEDLYDQTNPEVDMKPKIDEGRAQIFDNIETKEPDQNRKEQGIDNKMDFRNVKHTPEQQTALDKEISLKPTQREKGAEYLESGLLRAGTGMPDRLIKNEYEMDFNVELDDDFIPEDVRNFQENHTTSNFKGLGTQSKVWDGTNRTSNRGGKVNSKPLASGGQGDIDSIDLLGDM
jgi:integrin-linked kinase-associated serine/threonine phosphatase 2C